MKAIVLIPLTCACETCKANGGTGCATYPDSVIPAGTVLEWDDCWQLVYAGVAVPADEECEQRVTLNPQQLAAAQRAALRAAAGIHPEDFDAFDAGEMIGYYPDGTHIPGPNATITEGGILLNDFDND